MATQKVSHSRSDRGHQQQEQAVYQAVQPRPDGIGDSALTRSGVAEYCFGHCQVLVDYEQQRVTTIFKDGFQISGCPTLNEESVARARSLRYSGSDEAAVWAMTADHDLLHTAMAEAQGHPWSATLHAVAHGYALAPGIVEQEERLVLFAQRLQNAGLRHIVRNPS